MEQLPGYQELSQMDNKQLTEIFGIRDFYVYELDFAALLRGTSATGQFTVQADSNFLWQYACFFADLALAAQLDGTRVLPLVTATIQDSGSGRQLSSGAVPIPSTFGYGSLPFLLPTPRFFRAQTTVSVNLANYATATDYNIRLQFIGTKFFKFSQGL